MYQVDMYQVGRARGTPGPGAVTPVLKAGQNCVLPGPWACPALAVRIFRGCPAPIPARLPYRRQAAPSLAKEYHGQRSADARERVKRSRTAVLINLS